MKNRDASFDFLVSLWKDDASGEGKALGGLSQSDINKVSAALLRLQRGLTGERELATIRYMDDHDLLGAYLLYYWPASFFQATHAIERSKLHPDSIIDSGSGPGPVAAAFVASGARSVTLVDASRPALALAEKAIRRVAMARGMAVDIECVVSDIRSYAYETHASVDALSFGHVFNELAAVGATAESNARIVEKASCALSEDGKAFLMEPASLAPSRSAIALRDELLVRGFRVDAPCPFKQSCPVLAAGPSRCCHDQFEWAAPDFVRELALKTGLDRESLKFTWFSFAKSETISATSTKPDIGTVVTKTGKTTLIDVDNLLVVSDPMLNKAGRVRFVLCGEEGLITFSAKKDDPHPEAAGFFRLQRGDRLSIHGAEQREGGIGFTAGTRITL